MTQLLSPSVRRFTALAILAVLLVGFWSLTIQPFLDYWQSAAREHERAQQLLSSYQQVIRDKAKWESRLEALQSKKYATAFIEGNNPNLAAAKFQTIVKQTVERNGGVIGSIQVLPVTQERALQKLGVRVSFAAPLGALFQLLEQTEHGVPTLFIDNINVTAPDRVVKGGKDQPRLSVRCHFYAYLLPEEP